jgi:simple sugar transport system substrate-binding protein
MTDRADFLRRAGAGAAGIALAQLLAPAAGLAKDGGVFGDHPQWRFVFVSQSTLDPLFVPTQFGAQDAAALVGCSVRWTGSPHGRADETMKALRSAVAAKADGIVVSGVGGGAFAAQIAAAHRERIPLVAFNVDLPAGGLRLPYVGENPYVSGARVGAEITRLSPRTEIALLAPVGARRSSERRLEGIMAALDRAPGAPRATVVRTRGGLRDQQAKIEGTLARSSRLRGLYAVDGTGTAAAGAVIAQRGLRKRGFRGGGYDLLPDDLELVANGSLDFVVDQQPYVQGFVPVLQLFLARISQGTVAPWDAETSVLLRRPDVQTFLATKSRFEGSTSRHDYPLRRG